MPSSQVCQGTTKKNKPCTKRTRQGAYCHLHRPESKNDDSNDLETTAISASNGSDIEVLPPVPAITLSPAIKTDPEQSCQSIKEVDVKVEEAEDKEFVLKPPQRTNSILSIFFRQFGGSKPTIRDSGPTPRDSRLSSDLVNPDTDLENILIGLGLSPSTRNVVSGYLKKTRQSKEHIYIAISQPNQVYQHRIKIGRTTDLPRREREYEKCHMQIVTKFRMDHSIRVENLIHKTIKEEFKDAGKKSPNAVIQKIESLGRSVKCPCGGKHNDMFLTVPNYDYNTHYEELEQFVLALCRLERMETEDFFLDRTPLKSLVPEAEGGKDSEETFVDHENTGSPGGPATRRAKSEMRVLKIDEDLVRNKRTDHPIWVRGGRLRPKKAT